MAWENPVLSAQLTVSQNFEAFSDGTNVIVISANERETVNITVTVSEPAGSTDDLFVDILGLQRVSNGNTLAGATSTTSVDINAADNNPDGYWAASFLRMVAGGETANWRLITAYTSTNNRCTLQYALAGTPSAGEGYELYRGAAIVAPVIDVASPATQDNPNQVTSPVRGYEYYVVRARAAGSSNAHNCLMSYQKDGVSA